MTFQPTGRPANFKLVEFRDGEDFIMRPILRGLCRYESIVDGTLNLEDFARMNDAINISDENQRRANAAEAGK